MFSPDGNLLSPLVDQRDLILVTGKGGTGKSTLVAALARLGAARRGQAVAVEFSVRPRLPDLIHVPNVRLVNVDPETAVASAVGRLVGMPLLAQAVVRNRVVRQFIRTSPAMREMIALDELYALVEESSKRRAPVIVDLPATGHALSFLDTPRTVHRMFRIGPIANAAARIEKLLLDGQRTEMVTITLPEELPVNETIELVEKARQIGIAARMVVVNQVPAALLHPADRPRLELLQREGEELLARIAGAAQSQLDGMDHARAQIDRLRGVQSANVLEFPARPPAAPEGATTSPLPPARGSDLAALIAEAPLVVCVGPGGVGKTTVSAVLALRQAAAKKRALVLTIDPARRLADALGQEELTNDPVELGAFHKLHPGGTLSALMLDPTATFDHMMALLVPDRQRREALASNRVYQHISRGLSGTLEYMAVERVYELFRTGRFDNVVLDTPPTSNALDFLEAPDRIADFFSDKVARWFLPNQPTTTSWTSRLWSRAGSTALSLVSKVAGPNFVAETSEFFGAFSDLLGHFRKRGTDVGGLLRDPRTVFLVVCAPDAARLAEAKALDERLTDAGCIPRAFIVNRVEETFLPGQSEVEQAVERAASLLGGEQATTQAFMERLENLRQQQATAAAAHASVVEAVRRYAAPRPVFTIPRVPASESPREALLAMYVGLFAREK